MDTLKNISDCLTNLFKSRSHDYKGPKLMFFLKSSGDLKVKCPSNRTVTCNGLWVELPNLIRFYIENSGFWEGILAQIPGARRGFWKSPRARRAARGDFQNPRTGDGDLDKIPDQKPEFCTYFFSLVSNIQTLLMLLLSYLLCTFKRANYFNYKSLHASQLAVIREPRPFCLCAIWF